LRSPQAAVVERIGAKLALAREDLPKKKRIGSKPLE
jgi:hypothetical protein